MTVISVSMSCTHSYTINTGANYEGQFIRLSTQRVWLLRGRRGSVLLSTSLSNGAGPSSSRPRKQHLPACCKEVWF